MKLNNEKVESTGHWYTESGDSAHGATLREARKQNLYPSVTTVLSIIASPGLEVWKRQEAILAALTLPRNEGESLEDFAVRVSRDMEETGSKAASLGTSIHDWAESYCNGEYKSPPAGYETVCFQLQEWIDNNVDLSRSIAEESIVSKWYGYAGRVDLSGFLKSGKKFILDWKSQNLKDNGRNMVFYQKWCQQLTAYSQGAFQETELISIAVSTNRNRPIIAEKIWTEEEKNTGWEIFRRCLEIWQLEKGYRPE